MKKSNLILIVLIFNLYGCAFMPDNWLDLKPINKSQLANVSTIAVLHVATPSKYWMGDPVSGVASGLFGSLALVGAEHDSHEVFNRLYFSSTTTDYLKAALEKEGYKVTTHYAERPDDSKLLKDYSNFDLIEADAILDVGPMTIGYQEELGKVQFTEGELSPTVSLAFNLISPKTQEVIASGAIFYSSFYFINKNKSDNVVYKLGPREHIYENKESINDDIGEGLIRMKHAIFESTKSLAEFLVKNSQ